MDIAAAAVAVLALGFAIGSFWWIHARRGSLTVTQPRSYAFARSHTLRLRLPLAIYNTGARALIVTDLRVVLDAEPSPLALPWITTRALLRPEPDDGFAFATPFAVQGRATREVVVEFGDDVDWSPDPSSKHRMHLQAQVHPEDEWINFVYFDWWAPPSAEVMSRYITHRNEPKGAASPQTD